MQPKRVYTRYHPPQVFRIPKNNILIINFTVLSTHFIRIFHYYILRSSNCI